MFRKRDFEHLTRDEVLSLPKDQRPPDRTVYRWYAQPKQQPEFKPVHGLLGAQKTVFLRRLFEDWDRSIPFEQHCQQWQDLTNPERFNLIFAAMGGKFRVKPIPARTIKRWLGITT